MQETVHPMIPGFQYNDGVRPVKMKRRLEVEEKLV